MKNKNIKNKIAGILELFVALVLLVTAGWLYSKTWGIRLLFTDSSLGKVAGYYWILLLPAVFLLVLGIVTIRKRAAVNETKSTEEEIPAEEPAKFSKEEISEVNKKEMPEVDRKDEDKCPNCGAMVSKGNKFCVSCGLKLI